MKIWLWFILLFTNLVQIEKKKWDNPKNIITHNAQDPWLVVIKNKTKVSCTILLICLLSFFPTLVYKSLKNIYIFIYNLIVKDL